MLKQVYILFVIIFFSLLTGNLFAQNMPAVTEANDIQRLNAYYIPSASSIVVNYELPEKTTIKLMIFSADQRFGKVLTSGFKEAGKYCEYFKISTLSPGNYFYQLQTEWEIVTKSISLGKKKL
jgi:hypothetical protein